MADHISLFKMARFQLGFPIKALAAIIRLRWLGLVWEVLFPRIATYRKESQELCWSCIQILYTDLWLFWDGVSHQLNTAQDQEPLHGYLWSVAEVAPEIMRNWVISEPEWVMFTMFTSCNLHLISVYVFQRCNEFPQVKLWMSME